MLSARLARRVPLATIARRMYSEYPGSVAQSQGFSKKEKAHEEQYAREREQAELKKLRDEIERKKKEIEQLEKAAEKVENGGTKSK